MKKDIKKWIWQHEDYPNFRYDKSAFEDIILKIEYNRGLLNGLVSFFDKDNLSFIKTNALLNEIVNSYEIEGEILKRDSVRSSLMKRFDKNFDSSFDTSNHQSDALADILIDCATNKKPLSKSRLHGWHNVLFEHGYSGFKKINVAKFRTNDDMKVVSGAIGFEKTHYQAPPCKLIEKNMENFITYCNQTQENICIKSSIAHLWFVIIHPYDDGNGRIARVITDYLLS